MFCRPRPLPRPVVTLPGDPNLTVCHCCCGSAVRWKVPTSFIYGEEDIMDYRAGLAAAKEMPVPVEVLNLLNVSVVAWWWCCSAVVACCGGMQAPKKNLLSVSAMVHC